MIIDNRELRERYEKVSIRLGEILGRTGLTPNAVTALSIIMGLLSLISLSARKIVVGALLFLAAVFLDVVDGSIARAYNMSSSWGKLFDHYSDRTVEFLYILGLVIGGYIPGWLGVISVFADISPSYVRARGEAEIRVTAAGVGLFERKEKIAVLFLGSILTVYTPVAIKIATVILVAASLVTTVQRMIFFKKKS